MAELFGIMHLSQSNTPIVGKAPAVSRRPLLFSPGQSAPPAILRAFWRLWDMGERRMTIKGLPGEEWRDIPGYPGYKASNRGRIGSCKKRGGRDGVKRWHTTNELQRVMRPYTNDTGYKRHMIMGEEGPRNLSAHILVALAFLGPCPDGLEVCHNDGDPGNNRLENLRYDTHANNMLDAVRHESYPRAKREVLAIRNAYAKSKSLRGLANRFGVSKNDIANIVSGKRYGCYGGPTYDADQRAEIRDTRKAAVIAEAIHLRNQGFYYHEIAEKLGMCKSGVWRILNGSRSQRALHLAQKMIREVCDE